MPLIADLGLTITPATSLYKNLIADANITVSETITEGRNEIVLDLFQGDGVYSRDLGTIFNWATGGLRRTVLYLWQPSLIEQPETIYDRGSDWNDGGNPGDKYVQGV